MVSFNCQRCADVVKKPKIPSHAQQCGSKAFTCVDCMVTFDLDTIRDHKECISEVQRYQSKWQEKKHTIKASAEDKAHRPKFSAADFSDTDMDDDKPLKRSRPETSKMERRGMPDSDDEGIVAADRHHKTIATPKLKPVSPKMKPATPSVPSKKSLALPPPEAAVVVEAFELGTADEVMEMCVAAITAADTTCLTTKALAKKLTHDVYAKRIEKRITAALEAAFRGRDHISGGHMSADGLTIALQH